MSGVTSTHLRVSKLSVGRGGRALFSNLSFELAPRDWLYVVGESGIGKSSLLSTLSGQIPPLSGDIELRISDVSVPTSIAQRQGQIGFIYQNFLLTPNLNAVENVALGHLHRHSSLRTLLPFSKTVLKAAEGVLQALEIDSSEWLRPVRLLSGGQQQRVAVARALLQRPPLIFADEPVSGLDSRLAKLTLCRLKELSEQTGGIVVCATHDLSMQCDFPGKTIELGRYRGSGD